MSNSSTSALHIVYVLSLTVGPKDIEDMSCLASYALAWKRPKELKVRIGFMVQLCDFDAFRISEDSLFFKVYKINVSCPLINHLIVNLVTALLLTSAQGNGPIHRLSWATILH